MTFVPTRQHFQEAAAAVRGFTTLQPQIALVLGSGLNPVAEQVEDAVSVPYADIPHFPVSTIPGHQGRLVIGRLEGHPVIVMQGRAHYYEGYSMQQVTMPIRVFRQLGVETLILTNAAGGLNKQFRTGDLMLLTDHINLVGMAGENPLRGPNDPTLGPRFLDMSKTYDRQLRELAMAVAAEQELPLHQGVYVGLAGPTFETPADVRFLRMIGGDAVGMSTVPEAIVARHGGMRVMGVSGISNVAIDVIDGQGEASHEEVLEAGALLAPRMTSLVRGVLASL
ncbi:MAG: purine-nucleoside phosphorylase [Caldilineae bacterium]|nr:purine-nucleoside phosphorylase [Anaerolineae bacterium]MCB0205187.1 purine-nucleoside phosphorylase [Anaerolineae bacterium]MCB9152975.1 purine-nucleoside phosphorylase [Caldilineae bacterium]